MAILTEMPHQDIIDGLKGQIDFYYWRDLPVCRSWPRSPGKQRAPAVQAQWPTFTYATREWEKLSAAVRASWTALAQRSGLCGRDLQIRGYLSGVFRYPLE